MPVLMLVLAVAFGVALGRYLVMRLDCALIEARLPENFDGKIRTRPTVDPVVIEPVDNAHTRLLDAVRSMPRRSRFSAGEEKKNDDPGL